MKAITSNFVVSPDGVKKLFLLIDGDKFVDILDKLPTGFSGEVIDYGERVIIPGLVDTHVHINEPGRTDWEGFNSATQAAAAGGATTLVDMPLNCTPVTTSKLALEKKLESLKGKL